MTEQHLIDSIALYVTEQCCGTAMRKRILADRVHRATDAARALLLPHVPAGLWYWLVDAQVRESPRAYARRAVRYLVSRAAQAGREIQLERAHDGSVVVGMMPGHGVATEWGAGPQAVSHIERALDRMPAGEEDADAQ